MRYQLNRYMMFPRSSVRRAGSALEMEDDRIYFRCTPTMDPGEMVDWDILLPDSNSIVGGSLRVEALHRGRLAGDLIHEGRIVEMRSRHRDALMEWVGRQSVTCTPVEQPEHLPPGLLPAGATRPLPTLVPQAPAAPRPSSALGSSEVTPARVKPRDRMSRAIIDAAVNIEFHRRPDPERDPSRAPVWRTELPEPGPLRASALIREVDPQISITSRGLALPRIEVRYLSRGAYASDYDSVIRSSGFFVPLHDAGGLGQRGARALMQMHLPDGRQVHCLAEVVRPLPHGIGLQLELSADQHAELQRVRGT